MATKVFIDTGLTYTAGDDNLEVFGLSGDQILRIADGVKGTIVDANIERIELANDLNKFAMLATQGIGFQLKDTSDNVIFTLGSVNAADGIKVAFADGTSTFKQTGGAAFDLGGKTVNTDTGAIPLIKDDLGDKFITTDISSIAGTGTGTATSGVFSLAMSENTVTEGDAGTTATVTATITRTDASTAGSVKISTVDGSAGTTGTDTGTDTGLPSKATTDTAPATAGTDYIAVSETVSFAIGETSKTVTITINGDADVELDELFTVSLSDASNGTIDTATNNAVVTISNDDSATSGASTIAVNASGTDNNGDDAQENVATAAATTFTFEAGTYTYDIAGFSEGDKLDFPDTNTATVVNDNFTDGNLTVQWAAAGQVVQVNLTGIDPAIDGTILGTGSFATAFGDGSIA